MRKEAPDATSGGSDRGTHGAGWIADLFRRLLKRTAIDRAVVYVLATRVVMFVQGLITIVLVTRHLSGESQGFYYTFFSLTALQTFFELGLFLVIISMAPREWARLSLTRSGAIAGDPTALARLISLGRLACKWYGVVSVLFILVVGPAGGLFLAQKSGLHVHWQGPWCALVVLSGISFFSTALLSLLEGCNQVSQVTLCRLCETLMSRVALWTILLAGGGLWAAPASVAVGIMTVLWFAFTRYRNFLRDFLRPSGGEPMSWMTEIWPMQWRVGLTVASSYFSLSVFVPIMFSYWGPVAAGQMGMTLQAMTALHQAAMAWVSTKVPRYGILVSERRYEALDRLWLACSAVSVTVMAGGCVALWVAVSYISGAGIAFAQRILDPTSVGLILLAATILQVSHCQTAFLRAHRREPMAWLNVASSFMIGGLALLLGSRFGAIGIGIAYLIGALAVLIAGTVIWSRFRRAWRQGEL